MKFFLKSAFVALILALLMFPTMIYTGEKLAYTCFVTSLVFFVLAIMFKIEDL